MEKLCNHNKKVCKKHRKPCNCKVSYPKIVCYTHVTTLYFFMKLPMKWGFFDCFSVIFAIQKASCHISP